MDNFDPNNDPNVGTYIKLVAGNQHLCDLHVDGVTAITSTCYTRYDVTLVYSTVMCTWIKSLPLLPPVTPDKTSFLNDWVVLFTSLPLVTQGIT